MAGLEEKMADLPLDEPMQPISHCEFSGERPNLEWKACTVDDCQSFARFLPIPQQISMEKKPSHLFKQHSDEWHKLRNERLTASNLSCVLGFFEPSTVKMLKLNPQYYVNHQRVVHMASTMRQRVHSPQSVNESFDFPESVKTAMKWGSNHELNGILTFLQGFNEFYVKETGLWSFTLEKLPASCAKLGVEFSHLPAIGASPDGLVCRLKDGDPVEYFSEKEEVVSLLEIKCPCPFKEKKMARKEEISAISEQAIASSNNQYTYVKMRPHPSVPSYYMPQLQCQMLVTGAKQCYYVCWTPTAGAKVYQVDFDDEYCGIMLLLIKNFYERFVLPKIEIVPSEDFFFNHPEYAGFVNRTIALACESKLVKDVKDVVVGGREEPLFHS